MKKYYFIFLQAMLVITYGQVGINTEFPNATLEIASQPGDLLVVDGVIPPKLEAEVLKSKDNLYTSDQIGAIVYVTTPIITSSPKTINLTSVGYYYFDGLIWQKLKNGEDITENIYTTDKILTSSRVIGLDDKTLTFNSNAVSGTDHFRVDEQTFNVDAVNHRVGIGTNIPTTKLDIDGDLRVRNLTESVNMTDKILVIDSDGVIKNKLETKGLLRAYIKNDILTDNDTDNISIINDLEVIDNPGGEFDVNTGGFTALYSGIYGITYTITAEIESSTNKPDHFVFGLLNSNNELIKKYTVLSSNFPLRVSSSNNQTGASFSFVEAVKLTAGSTYYFGASGGLNLIANPIAAGPSGAGIGSYFELNLINKL